MCPTSSSVPRSSPLPALGFRYTGNEDWSLPSVLSYRKTDTKDTVVNMGIDAGKKRTLALNLNPTRTASLGSSSSSSSLKPPRTPRFAEDTAVHSPAETRKMPFSDKNSDVPEVQVADLGFGYIGEKGDSAAMPASPRSPLKSAMRYPGSPRTFNGNPLSPTFREEQVLERREELTEKQQARDLVRHQRCHGFSECFGDILTSSTENQDESAAGQVRPTRCELQL